MMPRASSAAMPIAGPSVLVKTPISAIDTNTPTAMPAARDVVSILLPTNPSSAGSSVSAAIIMTSTAAAPEMARPLTNARPIAIRPSNEIITVIPANNTARPLESIESITACSGSRPLCKPSRYRETMNRA